MELQNLMVEPCLTSSLIRNVPITQKLLSNEQKDLNELSHLHGVSPFDTMQFSCPSNYDITEGIMNLHFHGLFLFTLPKQGSGS